MLKFIPPKEQHYRYASFGSGVMKLHKTIGAAKQSLAFRSTYVGEPENPGDPWYSRPALWREGFILENIDGEWYVLYHVLPGSKYEELPWVKKVWVKHEFGCKFRKLAQPTYRPESYNIAFESLPMTKEEYAEWRVRVELEKRGISGQ